MAKAARSEETRTATQRPVASWTPPSNLEAPPPREGMRQRWIATSILGEDKPHHAMKRMREGWQPRPADTVENFTIPTIEHGRWNGCIGVEGMILCEMPEDLVQQRNSHYSGKTSEQEEFTRRQLDSAAAKDRRHVRVEQEHSTSTDFGNPDLKVKDDD